MAKNQKEGEDMVKNVRGMAAHCVGLQWWKNYSDALVKVDILQLIYSKLGPTFST